MRKISFGNLAINSRFFDITQNGDEFIKISWTQARRVRDGKKITFRRSGNIYTIGDLCQDYFRIQMGVQS